jgi:hypothetical protein
MRVVDTSPASHLAVWNGQEGTQPMKSNTLKIALGLLLAFAMAVPILE